jgi:hypothetical protein
MILSHNNIILSFVIYTPFHIKRSHEALDIIIRSYKMKSYECIKYKDLIDILSDYNFNKDIIYFDNIKDDDFVYIKINGVKKINVLNFLKNILPNITQQKHLINIRYCFSSDYIIFNPYFENNILYRVSYRNMILHNKKDYAQVKYDIATDDNYDKIFFNEKYKIISKCNSIFNIDIIENNFYPLLIEKWDNDVKVLNYSGNISKLREIKLDKLNIENE